MQFLNKKDSPEKKMKPTYLYVLELRRLVFHTYQLRKLEGLKL
jgi:hypothetical protein